MPNPFPVNITDTAATVRLEGSIDFTSPGNQPGPAAGTVVPVANPAGVVVIDDTTYADVIAGVGFYTTLVFTAAGDRAAVAIARAGEAFPRLLITSEAVYVGDGTVDPFINGAGFQINGAAGLAIFASGELTLNAATSISLVGLPGAPGAAGTLWVDAGAGGAVKVAP